MGCATTRPGSCFRVARYFPLLLAAALIQSATGATPEGGTLSPTTRELTFTSGPHAVSNPTASVQDGGVCNPPTQPCDHYELTVELPADYKTTNPDDTIRIVASWPNPGEDFDFYLIKPNGTVADDAATSDNPEIMEVPAGEGTQSYRVRVLPFAVAGGTATVTITLVTPPPPPPDSDGDGVSDPNDLCPDTPPDTIVDAAGCPASDLPELPLHFHGNTHEEPEPCTGVGANDVVICGGPFLKESGELDPDAPAARFDFSPTGGSAARTVHDPNWTWTPTAPATVKGYTVVNFWASCNTECILLGGSWDVEIFKNGAKLYEFLELEATPEAPDVPSLLSVNFRLSAPIELNGTGDTLTMKVEAHFTDTGSGSRIYYDSVSPCPGVSGEQPCDSIVIFNAIAPPPPPPPPPPLPPSGLPPRFYDFQSPSGLADSAGEPTIGYNPFTKNAMFIAITEVDRVTFAENSDLRDAAGNVLPEACEPVWQDKSYDGAATTLDPILHTERSTGRTFQSSLSGANSIFAFSDDDGDLWIPGQAGPPNGGVDHQTVGTGPWAPGAKPPSATEDYAVYYCSQSIAAAFCARSDNGGASFGPGIPFRDTATDCDNTLGGLHGHVQVARDDGAVYVPFGNCGNKVAVARSFDSGVTWDVKKAEPSQPGDDPGLGIASDGTLYLCYADDDNKIFATKSVDQGLTWSAPYELGAALGIKHAVFATATAGDPDRAACAFLGTTTLGTPQAEDFEGVWYPYVSTTYDGGESWHTVNVSPGDPVQGWGGICLGGISCGGNRNLLDFNDIIVDDDGRLLFAYADGCRGTCVQDPTKNTFSDNGVVSRQSGGRTLLAAFDDKVGTQFNSTTPVKPAAACARADLSRRTNVETRVAWTPPDDGSSPILNYEVYRAENAAGPFTLVGESGPKTSFLDATADPLVAKYYYRVVAENALGTAPVSNVIELPVTVPLEEDSCVLPGVTVAAEGSPGACTGTGGGCTPQTDIQRLHVAELESQPDIVTFTMKVASLAPAPAAGTYWFLLTKREDGGNLYFAMDTGEGAARFTYGTYEVGTLTTFAEQGTIDGAFETNGNIYLHAPKELFGNLQDGDAIPSIEGRTRSGDASLPSRDVLGPGDYTLRGTKVCLPNTPPVARLRAEPQTGDAPLTVTFDGSESFDFDTDIPDTIARYVIDFGDGMGASAEDGAPPVWTHTYANPGVYSAKLRVTDSRNKPSDNAAERVIEAFGDPVIPDPRAPVAKVPPSFAAQEGTIVELKDAGSFDPDGDPLTYQWQQVGSGPSVTLVDANTPNARFTAPQVGSDTALTFRLTVSDGALSDSAQLTVTVLNVREPVSGNNRIGGALSSWALAALGLIALFRQRRR